MSWAIVLLPTQSIFHLLQLLRIPEREWHRENIFYFVFHFCFFVFKNEAISRGDDGGFCLLVGYLFIGYSSALSLSSPVTHVLLV